MTGTGAGAELAGLPQRSRRRAAASSGSRPTRCTSALRRSSTRSNVPFVHIATPTADALLADGIATSVCSARASPWKSGSISKSSRPWPGGAGARCRHHQSQWHHLRRTLPRHRPRRVSAHLCRSHSAPDARGAEAVILGCTEIGMLIDDDSQPASDLRHDRTARRGAGRRSPRPVGQAAALMSHRNERPSTRTRTRPSPGRRPRCLLR